MEDKQPPEWWGVHRALSRVNDIIDDVRFIYTFRLTEEDKKLCVVELLNASNILTKVADAIQEVEGV